MSSATPSSTQTPYTVQSQRLRLEPLNPITHLQECHLLLSHPECTKWSSRDPYTLQQTTDWLSSVTSSETPKDWAIILLPTSEQDSPPTANMIGMIGIHATATFPEGGLAYRSDPGYWGRGYMTEAVGLFLVMFWGLEEFKSFDRLGAGVDPDNHASRKVLEKSGFVKGDLRKEAYERAVNRGKGLRKGDIQVLWMERPGVQ